MSKAKTTERDRATIQVKFRVRASELKKLRVIARGRNLRSVPALVREAALELAEKAEAAR